MTHKQLDDLAVLDETTDVGGHVWLICVSREDAPRPFVVLHIVNGQREFSSWALSERQAKKKVADHLLTARAIEAIPASRRTSPTKATPR